jgi:hypothetical protein
MPSLNPAIKRRAFLAGHTWDDPEMGVDDFLKEDLGSPHAMRVWGSWRRSDANYDTLLQAKHGPGRIPGDPDWGPATEALISLPRCPLPDRVPPDGLNLSGLYQWEQELIENYREKMKDRDSLLEEAGEESTGSGSWPVGCVPEYPENHAVRVNVDTQRRPPRVAAYFDRAVRAVIDQSAEIGLVGVIILDGEPQRAEIEVQWKNIPGNTIGYQFFPSPNACNQTISGRLDTAWTPEDWRYFAELFLHEHFGHGILLEHTRGGHMNPSIILPSYGFTWIGDPHERTVTRFFGGQPVDPDVPEPPGPPIPSVQPYLVGTKYAGVDLAAIEVPEGTQPGTYPIVTNPPPGVSRVIR